MTDLVRVQNISLSYSKDNHREYILKDFSLSISAGEFTCILGPSGCGKSSLLGLIAGFVKAESGSIIVAGQKVHRPDISRTLVFQEYALFPWLNVIDNVAFGLKYLVPNKSERYMIATRYLQMVGLARQAKSSIAELSGGMKQRVALARALVVKPQLLLMDEPFAALDDTSRSSMQKELTRIWSELKPSVIFITHSIDEALLLADRIIVMSKNDNPSDSLVKPPSIRADIRIPEARPRELSSLATYRQQILDSLASASVSMAAGQVAYDAGI